MKHALLLVSLLDGKGLNGIETQCNHILRHAPLHEIDAELVSPYSRKGIGRRCAAAFTRALAGSVPERIASFDAWVERKTIEGKLGKLVPRYAALGRTITLCAYDPLSAQAALRFKVTHGCRVVIVIHCHIPVAEGTPMTDGATRDGLAWQSALRTKCPALLQVDHIVFVSDFMRKLTLERMPELGSVSHSVIPNSVDEPPVPDTAPDCDGDLIAIGTLEPRKNYAFLFRILFKAAELGHRYTLTLVGNGPEEARLQALANELGIAQQVRFGGFRRNAGNLIARHRVLAQTAPIENMPITLIEALATGRPILAPAVGGTTEIFEHGVEGYHWPLQDADAAAAMLIDLLGKPDIYQRFSRAASLRYRCKSDGDLLIAHWLTTVLNSHGSNHAGWQKTWIPARAAEPHLTQTRAAKEPQ